MSWILYFLIFFFLFLVLYPFFSVIREGAKNNSDNSSDDSSSNDDSSSSDLGEQLQDLSGNVSTLQSQVNGILQSQQQYTNQMAPAEPHVTGAVDSGPSKKK